MLTMLIKVLSFLILFLSPDLLPCNICAINLKNQEEENDFADTILFFRKIYLKKLQQAFATLYPLFLSKFTFQPALTILRKHFITKLR